MLPLHTTFKSLAFALFILFLASCSSNPKRDIEIVKALNESIESSNKMLSISIMDEMISLRDKLEEPGSTERAKIWYPRAERIQQLSKDVFDYIENRKNEISTISIKSSELFEELENYQKQILQVDSKITNEFRKSIKLFIGSIDYSNKGQEELFKDYFKNIPYESMIALLNKLQNNIKINELKIITFCNEHVGRMDGGVYGIASVVTQSSMVLRPKDTIEISAGILTFDKRFNPKIFIYEKEIDTRGEGFAFHKIRVASRPGKYYVPVKINYTDQNGKTITIQKEIEYTVAHIQKQ